jgi:hypothetical protein
MSRELWKIRFLLHYIRKNKVPGYVTKIKDEETGNEYLQIKKSEIKTNKKED